MCKYYCLSIFFIILITGGGASARERIAGSQCRVQNAQFNGLLPADAPIKAPSLSNVPGAMAFTCSARPLNSGERVAYCWHIHDGSNFDIGGNYRVLENKAINSLMGFNFKSHGQRVGSAQTSANIWGQAAPLGGGAFQAHDQVTLYLDHIADWAVYQFGHYLYHNPSHVRMVILDYRDTWSEASACGDSNSYGSWQGEFPSGPFSAYGTVDADVYLRAYCTVNSENMVFDKQMGLSKPVIAHANVTVNCVSGLKYNVTIGNGNNYTGGARRMKHISNADGSGASDNAYVSYAISPESWSDTGTQTDQVKTVTGTVPPQETAPAGKYQDTLLITITHQ